MAALSAVPARAGTVTTTNACLYSANNEYRDQLVTLTGSGSPAGAGAGATATLSGASLSATLPPSLPRTGYELGIFSAGYNAIPSKVWIAIAASNAAPATQVSELSVTASTTIQVDANGAFVSGTPIVVSIPIPDTTWTVAADGPVEFSQAGPGALPSLPIGVDDAMQRVAGSIVVKPKLANLRFVLDCQPGSTTSPFKTFSPAVAAPFAGLEAAAPLPPATPPPPPPPPPPPAAAASAVAPRPVIVSTKLQRLGGRVGLRIACPAGTATCAGRVSIRSLAPIRLGKRRSLLTITARGAYAVAAGKQGTVRLTLTPAARRLMRTRPTVAVRVTLHPVTGARITRVLSLRR